MKVVSPRNLPAASGPAHKSEGAASTTTVTARSNENHEGGHTQHTTRRTYKPHTPADVRTRFRPAGSDSPSPAAEPRYFADTAPDHCPKSRPRCAARKTPRTATPTPIKHENMPSSTDFALQMPRSMRPFAKHGSRCDLPRTPLIDGFEETDEEHQS